MPKIFRSLEVQSLNIGLTDSVITQDLPKTVLYGLVLSFNVTHTNSSGTVVVSQDTFGEYCDIH